MEALSPTQIETLLADRLKRHEERLREHRSSLENQKAWIQRNSSITSSSTQPNNNNNTNNAATSATNINNNTKHPMYSNPNMNHGSNNNNNNNSTIGTPTPTSVSQTQQQHYHHNQNNGGLDPRYEAAFSPTQVLPQQPHRAVVIAPTSASSSRYNNNMNPVSSEDPHSAMDFVLNTNNNNNDDTSLGAGGALMNATNRQQQHHQSRSRRATTPLAGGVSHNLKKALEQERATIVMKNGKPTPNIIASSSNAARVSLLHAALNDREQRTSMMSVTPKSTQSSSAKNGQKHHQPFSGLASSFIPLNDYTDRDILSGESLMNVAAGAMVAGNNNNNNNIHETSACCTFRPSISEDSRILAKKLRTACGATGHDVVASMEALHAKATKEKWLRMQAIHEEETKQFHTNYATTHRRATTPSATHDRLHAAATRKTREDSFRQMIDEATQDINNNNNHQNESSFTPAITARAKSLKRHPGHNVGEDLYSLAVMKQQRDGELQQMRDELEYVTARKMGNPVIDAVSESIASALVESSFERLTTAKRRYGAAAEHDPASNQPQPQQPTRSSSRVLHGNSSRSRSGSEATFRPELNRRSQILAANMRGPNHNPFSPTKAQIRKEEKMRALRKEVEDQRMEDCTFQPNIVGGNGNNNNNNTKQENLIAGSSGYDVKANPESRKQHFYDRNAAWLKKKEQNVSQLRVEKEKSELEECAFAPNTNFASASVNNNNNNNHQQQQQPPPAQPVNDHSYLNSIYGGAEHRAWGFDQHLDRLEAARIIENDRKERAETGKPFSNNITNNTYVGRFQQQHQQPQPPTQQQKISNQPYRSSIDDMDHRANTSDYYYPSHQQQRNDPLPSSSTYQTGYPLSNNNSNTFTNNSNNNNPTATTTNESSHVRNSVLSRAEEALARAMAVSGEQQRSNSNNDYDYSRRW